MQQFLDEISSLVADNICASNYTKLRNSEQYKLPDNILVRRTIVDNSSEYLILQNNHCCSANTLEDCIIKFATRLAGLNLKEELETLEERIRMAKELSRLEAAEKTYAAIARVVNSKALKALGKDGHLIKRSLAYAAKHARTQVERARKAEGA